MVTDVFDFIGKNFEHCQTFCTGCSRNGTVGHCIPSTHTDVRQLLKDRGILSNTNNYGLYHL